MEIVQNCQPRSPCTLRPRSRSPPCKSSSSSRKPSQVVIECFSTVKTVVVQCLSLRDNCVNFNLLRLDMADFLGLLDKSGFARRSVVDMMPVEPVAGVGLGLCGGGRAGQGDHHGGENESLAGVALLLQLQLFGKNTKQNVRSVLILSLHNQPPL